VELACLDAPAAGIAGAGERGGCLLPCGGHPPSIVTPFACKQSRGATSLGCASFRIQLADDQFHPLAHIVPRHIPDTCADAHKSMDHRTLGCPRLRVVPKFHHYPLDIITFLLSSHLSLPKYGLEWIQ